MQIKDILIKELKPAPYNPRKIEDSVLNKIADSIKEDGFLQNVLVNKDMTIIAGHQRVKAAEMIGMETVPVQIIDVSKEKERELNIKLNKLSGDWDEELLKIELEKMTKEEKDKAGFDEAALLALYKEAVEGEEDDFSMEPPQEPKAKMGDIYQLGEHRLMCGDSTKKEDVEKLMDGNRAHMVFTDPPYNVDYKGGMNAKDQNTRDGIQNDKMSSASFYDFLYKALKNMVDFTDGCLYVCMSSSELVSLKKAFEAAGGHWQSFIIWAKNTFTLSRSDWQNQYEPILYGWNNKIVNHYFVGWRNQGNVWKEKPSDEALLAWAKTMIEKTETDVWQEKKPSKSPEHPTMKPIKLIMRALQASSRERESVLDLFGGSGSTLIACEQAGRRCFMMELDEKYVDTIIARWEKFTGNKAVKIA